MNRLELLAVALAADEHPRPAREDVALFLREFGSHYGCGLADGLERRDRRHVYRARAVRA